MGVVVEDNSALVWFVLWKPGKLPITRWEGC